MKNEIEELREKLERVIIDSKAMISTFLIDLNEKPENNEDLKVLNNIVNNLKKELDSLENLSTIEEE